MINNSSSFKIKRRENSSQLKALVPIMITSKINRTKIIAAPYPEPNPPPQLPPPQQGFPQPYPERPLKVKNETPKEFQ